MLKISRIFTIKNVFSSSFLAIVFVFLLYSCGGSDEKFISEGEIVYDASVVDESNPLANMAPSKMTFKFKNNMSIVEMSAGMGLFSTTFISNPTEQNLTQLVKLLNKKFSLVLNKKDLEVENKNYPFEFIKTDETKVIAGYNCKKVHVKVDNEFKDEFDIYYTNDLDIETPNFATPFKDIEGVLMEYQMKKFGLEMKFTAKTVTKCEIDDESFKYSTDYKRITKEEMNEIFLGIQ